MAVERFLAGRPDVATKNTIVAIAVIATVEALIWLVKARREKRWPISSDSSSPVRPA
jgi:hypothetical protein